MCVFLKLFVHELLYKFFDSIDLNVTREINIIATSSAELFSAVLYRALECSGVLWRALECSGVH
jgi:hypothetical protein